MNKVIINGRITKDLDLKQTPSGTSVVRFTVAVNRRFKNADGNYDSDFISCIAWRNTAEFISRNFAKGDGIMIVGSIQTQNWTDKDGRLQYSTEVNVEEAVFPVGAKKNVAETNSVSSEFGDFADFDDGEVPF